MDYIFTPSAAEKWGITAVIISNLKYDIKVGKATDCIWMLMPISSIFCRYEIHAGFNQIIDLSAVMQ